VYFLLRSSLSASMHL